MSLWNIVCFAGIITFLAELLGYLTEGLDL
jgi:hypothetical protein